MIAEALRLQHGVEIEGSPGVAQEHAEPHRGLLQLVRVSPWNLQAASEREKRRAESAEGPVRREIGRASCRERGESSVVAGQLKKTAEEEGGATDYITRY